MENNKLSKEDIAIILSKSTIKTAIQLLPPPIGNYIVNVIDEYSYKNIEIFMNLLKDRIAKIENSVELLQKQDKRYFTTIFIDIIEKIKFEFIEDKLKYFKTYFVNTLIDPVNEENYDKRTLFLDILKNMSIQDIKLLNILHGIYPELIKIKDFLKESDFDKYLIKSFMEKMKFYGILELNIYSIATADPQLTSDNMINLTSLGKEFCNFCINE